MTLIHSSKRAGSASGFLARALVVLPLVMVSFTHSAWADHSDAEVVGVADVTDGDTIKIGSVRIRIFGIDAPEGKQICGSDPSCGQTATDSLNHLVAGRLVTCFEEDTDRYGRMVGRCYADGIDIGEWMVRQGHAMAYRYYSQDYVGAEDIARAERLGIWQQDNMIAPWDWRRGMR